MQHERYERFLWGQGLLFGLLGAALGLFLSHPSLRAVHSLPALMLVLATTFMLAGALVAVLSGIRFGVEGRRFDLFLCCGFFVTSVSWLAFSVAPTVAGTDDRRTGLWAVVGRTLGWGLVAIAPFVRGRVTRRRFVLANALLGCVLALIVLWVLSRSIGGPLPEAAATTLNVPEWLNAALAAGALLHLLSVVGFSNRFRLHGEDLDYWLALGSTLMLFSSLYFVLTPPLHSADVSQGDYLQVLAFGVLLVGVWRAIRSSEFGRAVAEERARVAREIHDGLAQYLFTISTHAAMLEGGADPATIVPRLKEAALSAQQEARYAILALSSASGRAPFDAALRRYIDMLTADGALEVELTIDPAISLGPDEQIELFKIVQEGLANARKHAGARRAWVEIGARLGDRIVEVRDDGAGFAPGEGDAGQGLGNMRDRAAAIGGAFSLRSTPGGGTALEVVLRA